jgi:phosphoenolpyruvate carboxylase
MSSSDAVMRTNIYFAEKDQALREDVRQLGELVGDLVKEQGGEALFDLVEAARRIAIANREAAEPANEDLHELLSALMPRTAIDFIRAFSTYFQMVNMAEKVHRIRRRRAYLQDASRPQPEGFVDTLGRLRDAGVEQAAVEKALNTMLVEPIFTVQLTEVTRRTLLGKQQRVAELLAQIMHPYMTRQERATALGQIRLEMTTGWQTEDQSQERRVGDEGEHILFFLTDVLYRIIPTFYEGLEDALVESFGESARRIHLPMLVKFGSWVGGDMDGDPDVTAKSIRANLVRQRSLVLDLYYNDCHELARFLSQSDTRIGVAPEIVTRSELYAAHFPKTFSSVPARHRNMPYRVLLCLIAARLQATFDEAAFPYESPEEFIFDIELIANSLRENRGQNAGLFAVTRLLRRARTFGFHMAALDIRQSADVHRRVVGQALNELNWMERSESEVVKRVKDALNRRESPLGTLSSEGRRTLAVFQTIAHCRRKYGRQSIGHYIVSMTRGPADVLAVLLLARWGSLGPKNTDVPIDIVPFFETVGDLENVAATMTGLLSDERYRQHLSARDERQFVMIGYGDSNQNTGVVAACWSMHKAQLTLVETARRFNVKLKVFHGRGGTISRSGRRLHEAVQSAPQGGDLLHLRMTEQGERIGAKYGLRGIALRTLERTTSALLNTLGRNAAPVGDDVRWNPLMQTIADESRRAYVSLVEASANFDEYFKLATPIDVIQRLGIGAKGHQDTSSAPAAVGAHQWEFAWTQNRCLMPGWYGFAAGIARGIEQHGEVAVLDMFSESPFARVLISDIELTLAKADLTIASKYSELAGDLHKRFFSLIEREYEKSVAAVLTLTGQERLLEMSGTLRRAIRLRNPYMDPMNYLQVDLLRRWRDAGRSEDDMLKALQASINGIAHGMQNTG